MINFPRTQATQSSLEQCVVEHHYSLFPPCFDYKVEFLLHDIPALNPPNCRPTQPQQEDSLFPNQYPTLIFCNTIQQTERLYARLVEVYEDAEISIIHGKLPLEQIKATLTQITDGKFQALICTDYVSHGMDWNKFSNVINFDQPTSVAQYLTRAGRVGRWQQAAGARPMASCHTYFAIEDSQAVLENGTGVAADDATLLEFGTLGLAQFWTFLDALMSVYQHHPRANCRFPDQTECATVEVIEMFRKHDSEGGDVAEDGQDRYAGRSIKDRLIKLASTTEHLSSLDSLHVGTARQGAESSCAQAQQDDSLFPNGSPTLVFSTDLARQFQSFTQTGGEQEQHWQHSKTYGQQEDRRNRKWSERFVPHRPQY